MDDVVLDYVVGVCEVVSRDFGVEVKPEDVTDWNFGQFLDEHIGIDWWEWMEQHAWLWEQKFKPVPGALGGIEKLRRDGHRLELLTSKPKWAEAAVWGWLARYMRAPGFQRVTILPVAGREPAPTKAEASTSYLLVDDKFENCRDWAETGRPALLYGRPHNHAAPSVEGIHRVQDWSAVLKWVTYIDKYVIP